MSCNSGNLIVNYPAIEVKFCLRIGCGLGAYLNGYFLGIRETKLHVTRHTYASLLFSERVSPVYVKEQLGHSSIQMTVDVYGKIKIKKLLIV
jgi:hypothetical protein